MPKTKIFVREVNKVKSGTTNGKAWTLTHVVAEDGTKYSTFKGENYVNKVGSEIEIEYEEKPGKPNPNGGTYPPSKTIIEPKIDLFKYVKDLYKKYEDLSLIVEGLAITVEKLEKGQVAKLADLAREMKKDEPINEPPF